MITLLLNGNGDGKQLRLIAVGAGNDLGDPGLTLGEGAGLVESQHIHPTQLFERGSAFHQDSGSGRSRHRRQNRTGRGDRQRTRTGSHQHGECAVHGGGERFIDHEAGEQQQDDSDQNRRHENPLKPVGEPLSRGGLGLRLGHQPDDSGKGGVTGEPSHLDLDGAGTVDRPGEHPRCRVNEVGRRRRCRHIRHRILIDGNAFPGHGGLIDASGASHDEAVGSKPHVGSHDDDIPNAQVAHRHFHSVARAAAADQGRLRSNLGERFDRPAGSPHRIALERVADAEQEQQKRAFGDFTERRRTGGRHQHQEVDLEPTLTNAGEGFLHGEERTEEKGQGVDHQLRGTRCVGEGR